MSMYTNVIKISSYNISKQLCIDCILLIHLSKCPYDDARIYLSLQDKRVHRGCRKKNEKKKNRSNLQTTASTKTRVLRALSDQRQRKANYIQNNDLTVIDSNIFLTSVFWHFDFLYIKSLLAVLQNVLVALKKTHFASLYTITTTLVNQVYVQ